MLSDLTLGPSQACGAFRLVPLLRQHCRTDLRLGLSKEPGFAVEVSKAVYTSYIPHALIVEWNDLPKDASSLALGILIFGGLGWLISAAIYSNSGIKPGQITDRYIELVGVNKAFATEWKASVSKPKKKKQYEDDDDL